MRHWILVATASFAVLPLLAADPKAAPKLKGNMAYFGRMPRAWVEILKIEPDRRMLTVRKRTGEEVEVPIHPDTNLKVRDADGELADYYPGQSVMLFVLHDAAGKWVYPRAVQDEIQMMSSHKWWWTVEAVDATAGTLALTRGEKDKTVRESFRIGANTKVWKGEKPLGAEAIAVGDKILFQTRFEKGQEKRFADLVVDAKGLEVIKAAQQTRHQSRLAADGWPAVVNDVDRLTGAVLVSVQTSAVKSAKEVKAGTRLELKSAKSQFVAPAVDSRVDSGRTHKFLMVGDPAIIVHLNIGDEVRIAPAP